MGVETHYGLNGSGIESRWGEIVLSGIRIAQVGLPPYPIIAKDTSFGRSRIELVKPTFALRVRAYSMMFSPSAKKLKLKIKVDFRGIMHVTSFVKIDQLVQKP